MFGYGIKHTFYYFIVIYYHWWLVRVTNKLLIIFLPILKKMLVTLQKERYPIFDHISMTTFLVHTNMAIKKSVEIYLNFCLFDI